MMKQSSAAFGLFAAVWVAWCELSSGNRRWGRMFLRLGWLALGGLLPFILTCLIIASKGEFSRFWFWAFQFAAAHGTIFTKENRLYWMFISIGKQFVAAPGLWSLAVLGLLLSLYKRSLQRWRFFIISFSFFSFLAVCPGWYFRRHYFIQVLPAAGLLAAVAFDTASGFFARHNSLFPRITASLIFAVAAASTLIQWSDIYFFLTPGQACRVVYGANPFPEAVEISRYLTLHCAPDARIAVIGSEPEIFFYSHHRSATGYICTYPLLEPQPHAVAMQHEMIQQIEKANPAYVIFINISSSWIHSSYTPDQDKAIFDWFVKYRQERLQLVGLVEIQPDGPTKYRWFDRPETNVQTTAESWLAIYKNRSAVENQPPKSR
jgi:hypothetical protein